MFEINVVKKLEYYRKYNVLHTRCHWKICFGAFFDVLTSHIGIPTYRRNDTDKDL